LIVVETALKLVVREVFEVLYSPVNAFRKIIEKPDFKGVLLVLVLVISSLVISEYVVSSKLFIENRLPENDDWTEALTNQHNWVSNGLLPEDDADYKMGNIDGNHSIASSVLTETSIWLKIADIASINCSETSYIELFFWIKWTHEEGVSPSSGTLKLFSGSEDSYFEYNKITEHVASSGEWENTTLKVGPDQGWTSNNSPDWQDITGIEFRLDWSSSANLTMKIDGLFFRKYSSPIITGQFSAQLPFIILQVVLNFAMNWVLWAGILMIVAKLFNEDLGHWNVFFVIIAYSFIVTVVYTLIRAVPFSTLPPLNVPLDADAFTALLGTSWSPLLAYQLWLYIPLIGEVWIAALGAVVVRLMKETTWSKAATIAAVAFAINYFLLPVVFSLLQSLMTV
jgi:hypothetical protein